MCFGVHAVRDALVSARFFVFNVTEALRAVLFEVEFKTTASGRVLLLSNLFSHLCGVNFLTKPTNLSLCLFQRCKRFLQVLFPVQGAGRAYIIFNASGAFILRAYLAFWAFRNINYRANDLWFFFVAVTVQPEHGAIAVLSDIAANDVVFAERWVSPTSL